MANWGRISRSGNVEDRRGMAPVAGGLTLGGIVLVLAFNYLTGGDLGDVLTQLNQMPASTEQRQVTTEYDGADAYETFASQVLGSNNDVWETVLSQNRAQYTEPRLVLFREATPSGCGTATSDIGPHYCPADQTIYLDETFFDELTNRLGARGGDVAEAYVISHEVGHHIQQITGISERVQTQQDAINQELQADCYAGMWAYALRDQQIFEPGEIAEAMDAASAVGDDKIQEKVTGRINPETWTHGSSEQRLAWFTRGYEKGDLAQCNTFN